ncbi:MAG: DUF2797 domain-containing protein [Flavobacterium sp.]|nr:DUF2797 domain-containing protein [Flavobacterium sp.]
MHYEGVLTKMQTEFGTPIQYYIIFENTFLNVNQLLGSEISIAVNGYQCLNCTKRKRIFRQGFCYDCFFSSPAVGDWIMRPELSTAHLGIADRDLDYETQAQLQPHVVYLAQSCEIKVGVTRKTQVPTRWIDQGAEKAITIVEVPNRWLAGITEVKLKSLFADKINWRKMLVNDICEVDLIAERLKIESELPEEVSEFFYPHISDLFEFEYPVTTYPKKVVGLNLAKTSFFTGKLIGIKGQYLMFADGTVFNVRAAEGTAVTITV